MKVFVFVPFAAPLSRNPSKPTPRGVPMKVEMGGIGGQFFLKNEDGNGTSKGVLIDDIYIYTIYNICIYIYIYTFFLFIDVL